MAPSSPVLLDQDRWCRLAVGLVLNFKEENMREKPKADEPVVDIEDADDLLRYLRETGRIERDETPVVLAGC
jgi:hypothetical protein